MLLLEAHRGETTRKLIFGSRGSPRIEFGVLIFSTLASWLFLFNAKFVLTVDDDNEADDAGGIKMAVGGGVVLSTKSGPEKLSADEPGNMLPVPKAPPFKVLNRIVPCW